MTKRFLLFLTALILIPAFAIATAEEDFTLAKECYKKLTPKSSTSDWLNCIDLYGVVSANDPDSPLADKATYNVARLRTELYDKEKRKEDLLEAIEFYNRVVNRHPKSALADDSLFMIATLRHLHLKDDQKAKAALDALIERYPNGDKKKDAEKLLANLKGETEASPKTKVVKDNTRGETVVTPPSSKLGSLPTSEMATPKRPAKILSISEKKGDDEFTFTIELDKPTVYKLLYEKQGVRVKKSPSINLKLFNAKLSKEAKRSATFDHPRIKKYDVSSSIVTGSIDINLILGATTAYNVNSAGNRIIISLAYNKGNPFDPNPKFTAVTNEPPKKTYDNLRIVIDPGHGGRDPGAIGPNGLQEKKVTLDIAKRLAKRLKKEIDADIWLTRTTDKTLSLEYRNNFAVKKNADIFLSIHANASTDRDVSGIETYFLNNATDKAAKRLAEIENKGAAKPMDQVEHILMTMLQNYNADESRKLAKVVHEETMKSAAKYDVRDLNVKSALFYVLVGSKCPGILLELSFISNPKEEERLTQSDYKDTLVSGISKGLSTYLSKSPN